MTEARHTAQPDARREWVVPELRVQSATATAANEFSGSDNLSQASGGGVV